MLQKGFLKPQAAESEKKKSVKNTRLFLLAGILFILAGFIHIVIRLQQATLSISIVNLFLIFAGFLLIAISMWMNFFAQKNYKS